MICYLWPDKERPGDVDSFLHLLFISLPDLYSRCVMNADLIAGFAGLIVQVLSLHHFANRASNSLLENDLKPHETTKQKTIPANQTALEKDQKPNQTCFC